MLDDFVATWTTTPRRSFAWDALLFPLQCASDGTRVRDLARSLRLRDPVTGHDAGALLDAIEPLARMLVFPCSGTDPLSVRFRDTTQFHEREGPPCTAAAAMEAGGERRG